MSALRLDHLNRSFGSLVVTDDISLDIAEGERHVIIGPNGAGKTSLVNQIGGQLAPSSGQIFVAGVDITGRSPDQISRMGVARTFQRNNLFQNLSVIENLRLALEVRFGNPLGFFRPADRNDALMARAADLMARVHLGADGTRTVRNLSYGEQRQLEIGLALAGDPKILLLDEPTSGMSSAETARMIDLIASLPRNLAILMIEHDMKVVFSVADRVTVLYYGKILATGTPDEIQANTRVREVYLGGEALMLELENVHAYYGESHVLRGVSLSVAKGEVVCLLGRNGAGKTTTILTVMGYLHPRDGRIRHNGRDIGALPPYAVSRLGVGFVPQERGIFPSLTVRENLTVFARGSGTNAWTLQRIFELFPHLKARERNLGFQLSGGEQQMLSIARALMLNPALLVLDEPSEGLAPMIVEEIVGVLRGLKREGLAILLVEQNLRAAFAVGDRHHIMNKGEICFTGTSAEIESNEDVLRNYLSV